MVKFKLISKESNFDLKTMLYGKSTRLYQIHWFPEERVYRIRDLSKQECFESKYTHEEIFLATTPRIKDGVISFKIQE